MFAKHEWITSFSIVVINRSRVKVYVECARCEMTSCETLDKSIELFVLEQAGHLRRNKLGNLEQEKTLKWLHAGAKLVDPLPSETHKNRVVRTPARTSDRFGSMYKRKRDRQNFYHPPTHQRIRKEKPLSSSHFRAVLHFTVS